MLAVVQRVSEARVVVADEVIGQIGVGLLVLVCAERGDAEAQADKLLAKLLKLRMIFVVVAEPVKTAPRCVQTSRRKAS